MLVVMSVIAIDWLNKVYCNVPCAVSSTCMC